VAQVEHQRQRADAATHRGACLQDRVAVLEADLMGARRDSPREVSDPLRGTGAPGD
jgi:type II secretory pathway component PulJ